MGIGKKKRNQKEPCAKYLVISKFVYTKTNRIPAHPSSPVNLGNKYFDSAHWFSPMKNNSISDITIFFLGFDIICMDLLFLGYFGMAKGSEGSEERGDSCNL